MGLTPRDALDRTLRLARDLLGPDASDGVIVSALLGTRVCIVADGTNAASNAAQSAICTLVGLVLACGMQVRLVIPRVAVTRPQPPIVGDDLAEALVDYGADSVPGASVCVDTSSRDGDLVFVIGDAQWHGAAAAAWRLQASAWSGSITPVEAAAQPLREPFPLGALGAATAAAAEPFRHALRTVAERTRCDVSEPELLVTARMVVAKLAPERAPTPPVNLGRVDFISGGAIVSACFHALLRVPTISMDARVFEPQTLDGTNLNRYPLARRSQLGMRKVDVLEHWARFAGVSVDGRERRLTTAALATERLADRVVVGTDNVESRWLVQGTWPAWLGVAGTAGLMVMASEHIPGTPCAGCLHPCSEQDELDVAIPTVSFVSYWAGLLLAARLVRDQVVGHISAEQQATLLWAGRMDGRYAWSDLPVPRQDSCPVSCHETCKC